MKSCNEARAFAEFVEMFPLVEQGRYRSPTWLVSKFTSPIWKIRLGTTNIAIDWRVRLEDGKLLTHRDHITLLTSLRLWMAVQSHPDLTGGRTYSPESERAILQRAVHCIDYLLIRSESLELAKFGLNCLTPNALRELFCTLGSQRSIFNSVYDWPARIAEFLRTTGAALPQSTLEQVLINMPAIADVEPTGDRLTDLTEDEIVSARAWLWLNGYYKNGTSEYAYEPRFHRLLPHLYERSIWAKHSVAPIPPELRFLPEVCYGTEYPRAHVHSGMGDKRMLANWLRRFASTVQSLQLLDQEGLAPLSLQQADWRALITHIDVKTPGRFKTIPYETVSFALRRAIEFVLIHGDTIVECALGLARAARKARTSIFQYSNIVNFPDHITEAGRKMGIRCWAIASDMEATDVSARDDYFNQLRRNAGLYECIRVLLGAVQVIVGTLTAQRSGALRGLVAGECLLGKGDRIQFGLAKSGHSGLQETVTRPIPHIATVAILILEKLQSGLSSVYGTGRTPHLFSAPRMKGKLLLTPTKAAYDRSLDMFCDWIESPRNAQGERLYFRQHQLRRFFAMAFFWSAGYGGMDTLRWFLGHTDAAHLWHYITESTPGQVLRSVAAQWGANEVSSDSDQAIALREAIRQRFHIDDFSLLDEDALQEHLEDLIAEGIVTIEPLFIDKGETYRIAVHICYP